MSETDEHFVEQMEKDWNEDLTLYDMPRLFALARRGAAVQWRPTHRHVKRGSSYQRVGTARVQASGLIAEDDAVVVYRAEDGSLWARPMDEFNDGRFEPLPLPPAGETSDE